MTYLYPYFKPETLISTKPEFGITDITVNGLHIPVAEQIVSRRPFCDLVNFQTDSSDKKPKVLIVAPMSGHYAPLLREMVEGFVPHANVFITDWLNPRDVDSTHGDFSLNTYIEDLLAFIHHIGPNTHLVGVSQSTVMCVAAASLLAMRNSNNQLASLSLIAGPIDTRISPTMTSIWGKITSLDWMINRYHKKVSSEFNGAGRIVFDETGLSKIISPSSAHMVHEEGLTDVQRRLRQNDLNSIMGYCGTYQTQINFAVFKEHLLMTKELFLDGDVIDPSHVRATPLLTIEGGEDDIVGKGQTMAAHRLFNRLASNERFEYVDPDACHYGLIMGHNFRTKTLPILTNFIEQSTPSMP